MKYPVIIVLDFETNGFSNPHIPIELAAEAFGSDGVLGTLETFIKCKSRIKPNVSELTGITDKDVSGGVHVAKAIKSLLDLTGHKPCLLVGHNIKQFDLKILEHYAGVYKIPMPRLFGVFDTMLQMRADIARLKGGSYVRLQGTKVSLPKGTKTSLEAACDYYGVPRPEHQHRALIDVQTTKEIFNKQVNLRQWQMMH